MLTIQRRMEYCFMSDLLNVVLSPFQTGQEMSRSLTALQSRHVLAAVPRIVTNSAIFCGRAACESLPLSPVCTSVSDTEALLRSAAKRPRMKGGVSRAFTCTTTKCSAALHGTWHSVVDFTAARAWRDCSAVNARLYSTLLTETPPVRA